MKKDIRNDKNDSRKVNRNQKKVIEQESKPQKNNKQARSGPARNWWREVSEWNSETDTRGLPIFSQKLFFGQIWTSVRSFWVKIFCLTAESARHHCSQYQNIQYQKKANEYKLRGRENEFGDKNNLEMRLKRALLGPNIFLTVETTQICLISLLSIIICNIRKNLWLKLEKMNLETKIIIWRQA